MYEAETGEEFDLEESSDSQEDDLLMRVYTNYESFDPSAGKSQTPSKSTKSADRDILPAVWVDDDMAGGNAIEEKVRHVEMTEREPPKKPKRKPEVRAAPNRDPPTLSSIQKAIFAKENELGITHESNFARDSVSHDQWEFQTDIF